MLDRRVSPARVAGFLFAQGIFTVEMTEPKRGRGRPPIRPQLTPELRRLLAERGPTGETNRLLLMRKVLELAMAGDMQAIKLVYERVDGPIPVQVDQNQSGDVRITIEYAEIPEPAAGEQLLREVPSPALAAIPLPDE